MIDRERIRALLEQVEREGGTLENLGTGLDHWTATPAIHNDWGDFWHWSLAHPESDFNREGTYYYQCELISRVRSALQDGTLIFKEATHV